MNMSTLTSKIDTAIRFFLYLLIFWIPYSPAVIECCVIASFLIWVIKRYLSYRYTKSNGSTIREKIYQLLECLKPPITFLNTPIYLFILACILSTIHSLYPTQSFHGFLTKTLEWFIIYFLIIEVFKERKHIQIALTIFIITTFATSLDSLIQFYITNKDIFLGRQITRGGATAAFHHANGLGGYLACAIPIFLSTLIARFKERKQLWMKGVSLCVIAWSLIITFSRAAWFSVFIGCAFLIFFAERKLSKFSLVGILILMICLNILYWSNLQGESRISKANIQDTIDWRLGVWFDSFKMIKERPILGHGLNTYMKVFQEKYRRRDAGFWEYGPTYAHNCYIQVTTEVGILGLASFLWIIGRFFVKTIQNIQTKIDPYDLRLYTIGLLAGCTAFLTHIFFDTDLYSLQLSTLFWVMVGMSMATSRLLH